MTYYVGQEIRARTTFKNDGTASDPTSVAVRVLDPDGTETTPTPTNSSTGVYDAMVALSKEGRWYIEFVGTVSGTEKAAIVKYVDVADTPFD